MKAKSCTVIQPKTASDFDLFRLGNSKAVVDICANTLRAYNNQGLPFYRSGKAVFISKAELVAFIRSRSAVKQG